MCNTNKSTHDGWTGMCLLGIVIIIALTLIIGIAIALYISMIPSPTHLQAHLFVISTIVWIVCSIVLPIGIIIILLRIRKSGQISSIE